MILRDALKARQLAEPKDITKNQDAQVTKYGGWGDIMRVLAAVHEISSPESCLPTLQGVLLDRASISHRKRLIKRPVVHLLFDCTRVPVSYYQERVRERTQRVVTAGKGLMMRCHPTEEFLLDNRRRLSRMFPVYLTFEVRGLCPSVLKPGRLRRTLARLRHPLRGYGQYPKGPGW
jgi:hypothetical protein